MEERGVSRDDDSVRSKTGAGDASTPNPPVDQIEQPAAPAAPSPPTPSDDVVRPCPHVEEKVQWGPMGMSVASCKHAFTAGVDCDLVYCSPRCHEEVCPPKKGGGTEAEKNRRRGLR